MARRRRSGRIPASHYPAVEDAKQEAREYLVHHGGGELTLREGPIVIWQATIRPDELES